MNPESLARDRRSHFDGTLIDPVEHHAVADFSNDP